MVNDVNVVKVVHYASPMIRIPKSGTPKYKPVRMLLILIVMMSRYGMVYLVVKLLRSNSDLGAVSRVVVATGAVIPTLAARSMSASVRLSF